MKKQIFVIHGGDTFDSYEEYLTYLKSIEIDFECFQKKGWKETLQKNIGDTFEVITPRMPNSLNAKYAEWKIWFEKFIPYMRDEIIFVGHSLGGIFLAKYLSENVFPRNIFATFLIAAPFDATDSGYSLADFALPEDLSGFEKQGVSITLYHSTDDMVVPFADVHKYQSKLPNAQIVVFENKGHFNQEEFPELIKNLLQK